MDEHIWYLATCQDCEPVIPQPFKNPDDRTNWAGKHAKSTGHMVLLEQDVREVEEIPSSVRFFRCSKCPVFKVVDTSIYTGWYELTTCNINGCDGSLTEITEEEARAYAKEMRDKEDKLSERLFQPPRAPRFG
jgi:hypothetical protein